MSSSADPTREEVADLIDEMADEIEETVENRYLPLTREQYPSIQADYDRDMDVVRRGRAVAAKLRGEG